MNKKWDPFYATEILVTPPYDGAWEAQIEFKSDGGYEGCLSVTYPAFLASQGIEAIKALVERSKALDVVFDHSIPPDGIGPCIRMVDDRTRRVVYWEAEIKECAEKLGLPYRGLVR